MASKHSKLGVFLFVNAIICIVLKLLISYLFPLSRLLLLFLIVPITVIVLIIYLIKNRTNLLNKKVFTCWIVAISALVFTFLPIDRQLEIARFYVSKPLYNSAVHDVEEQLLKSEDTTYITGEPHTERYKLKFPYSLLTPGIGEVSYMKKGNIVVISFPVSSSLSITRDFVYFSSEKAKTMFEGYYDRMENFDSHWAYVFDWGNGNGMEPVDPNI